MRQSSEDVIMAIDFEEKIQILRERFFPPPQMVDLEDISMAYYFASLLNSMKFTLKEVAAAIQKPKPNKAPGMNKILNRFLRQVLKVFLPHFAHLFQACINHRYHPKEFWIVNTIVLKKPKKKNYLLAGLYCSIALLNILDKVLKTILAQRLSTLAENNNLFPI